MISWEHRLPLSTNSAGTLKYSSGGGNDISKVYHLIARTPYGLMVQMMAGLVTYLLLAIYCHENHGEKVSISRVLELRIKIRNEVMMMEEDTQWNPEDTGYDEGGGLYAKT